MKLELEPPSEPLELKNQVISTRNHFRVSFGPGIDVDSMAVWFKNAVAKYIWSEWRVTLKKNGLTWPKFLKLMKYNTKLIIEWVDGKISWDEFIRNVKRSIDDWFDRLIESLAVALYKDHVNWSQGKMVEEPWTDLNAEYKRTLKEQAAKIYLTTR